MMRHPGLDDGPELQAVLDALDDPDCREIVTHLEEPMTASEISEAADIPVSTTYRKLDLLTEASLLEETTEIREGGHHTTRYVLDFEAVRVTLSEGREFDVSIDRPARSADEQLAQLWSEVRRET
ncbi:MAG: helix-turn-helix domain-containing protein [Halobacteriales archaeon]